jgi:serine/threonine-protein kinase
MTQNNPVPKLQVGDSIECFRITGQINTRGGYAAIFKGEEVPSGRPVIVKVMKGGLSAVEQSLFRNEAPLLVEMRGHPNIVELLHHGDFAGTPFLIVEQLEVELSGKLPYLKPVPLADATDVMREVLGGLAALHNRDIVHHDVRPDNVLRHNSAPWKLIDLGVAHRRGAPAEGQVFGDKLYMSPEVIGCDRDDPRSDLYSAGVMYYLLLTGRTPFGTWRDKLKDVRGQHLQDPVRPPAEVWTQSAIPAEHVAIVMRLLEKVPSRRYQNAEEVLEDLARVP